MKRFPIALISIAAAALMAAPAQGTGIIPPTTVTIVSRDLDFHGKVSSPTPGCRANRKVRIYLKLAGADQLRGTDTTGKSGVWRIRVDGTAGATLGEYYAKATAGAVTPGGSARACQPGRSKAIPVTVS